jgi:1-acyl-sn-glycerol-3-phosphate acyltransferase
VWLRSWIYFCAFGVWTLMVAVLFLPSLARQAWATGAIRLWTRGVVSLARSLVRIDCRIEGREHVPAGGCIIAAQHQSAYETYRLFVEMKQPVFVLKRELTRIPLIGWYMRRAGLVAIDRGAGAGAMRKMLRATRDALARGAQVIVFPEGTRTPPGVHMPYRPGIVALYSYCDAPLVPMALNSGPYWGKTRILKRPGEIIFRFLPAMPKGLGKEEMLQELRARLEGANLPLPPQINS